jgi:two-component system, NarL family, response regulator YdfI
LIRVLVVIPSPALRAGIRSLISTDDEIKILDERSEWSDSLQEEQYEADVVITTSASYAEPMEDEDMALSAAAILFLRDEPFNIKFMAPASKVWGILPLETTAEELCAAVRALAQGLIVGTHQLLFSSFEEEPPARGPLTDRENEVLALLAKGLANKQIALILKISGHTVKFHVSSIYTKLNATNRTQAVREGLRNGWIVL